MSGTPTPETDAYGGVCRETHRIDGLTLYERSKKLERERDAARKACKGFVSQIDELECTLDVFEHETKTLNNELNAALAELDNMEECASTLAEIVGRLTGIDIGEHSNTNDPVANAIEAGEGVVSEIAEMRRDKARLDWLMSNWAFMAMAGNTDRDAIDAAMQEGGRDE